VDALVAELTAGFDDPTDLLRVTVRLIAATLLGAVIGLQRQSVGAAAGLRTHMIVALGATLFVVVPPRIGMSAEDLSRVIQGVATGIGFIGGGAILKRTEAGEISGLTTAAGLWLTTAIGIAAGLGRIGLAGLVVLLTWVILSTLTRVERAMAARPNHRGEVPTRRS
jgi:putative Mg2+ transporter-C (MgtC) family protein